MKKIMSAIIAVVITVTFLIGCGEVSTPINTSIRTYTTDGKETKLVPDETATGELIIKLYGNDSYAEKGFETRIPVFRAINKYKEMYPNVNLKVDNTKPDEMNPYEFGVKSSTEIMSGKGADIFRIMPGMDANKIMKSGAFADMYDFFENDINFNMEDYNNAVFYAGQDNGKQYIIPIGYSLQIMVTSKVICERQNFKINKCLDFVSTTNELGHFLKTASSDKMQYPIFQLSLDNTFGVFSGVDLENRQETEVVCKLIKDNISNYIDNSITSYIGGGNTGITLAEKILDNEYLMVDTLNNFESPILTAHAINYNSETEAVLLPIRNMNGSVTATIDECWGVSNSSKNKQNAYNFMKIYLNENYIISQAVDTNRGSIPVNNKAVENWMIDRLQLSPSFSNNVELTEKSNELIQNFIQIISEVDDANLLIRTKELEIFNTTMVPYFESEASFDSCYEKFIQAFKIYSSE